MGRDGPRFNFIRRGGFHPDDVKSVCNAPPVPTLLTTAKAGVSLANLSSVGASKGERVANAMKIDMRIFGRKRLARS